MATTNLIRLLSIAILASVMSVVAHQGSRAAALADIWVSFKLDPRLTQGLYMGDRWVSPPTYSRFGPPSGITIEVRAVGVDDRHKQVAIDATWTVADPELATVTPGRRESEAKITVHKEGQSELLVNSDDVSKKLIIKCENQDGSWRIDVSQ